MLYEQASPWTRKLDHLAVPTPISQGLGKEGTALPHPASISESCIGISFAKELGESTLQRAEALNIGVQFWITHIFKLSGSVTNFKKWFSS